uniref:Ubiquitin-like protease family profile domain-containing protein n=1 Tax=Amphimedon queenslandica TaxID=400682 RepID=A0A1X7T9I5_AMPQE
MTIPYDLSQDAEKIIISLTLSLHLDKISVTVTPVAKQSGCTDCGIYTIAIVIAICYKIDPVTAVFAQDELRPHLVQSFENNNLQPFPIKKNKKVQRSSMQALLFLIVQNVEREITLMENL